MSDQNTSTEDQAKQQAETIAAEGTHVRDRVRQVVISATGGHDISLHALLGLMMKITDGALAGVNRAIPEERESILRQVVDGLGDGFSTAANTTRLAIEEARARGETFAHDDVEKVAQDLRALGEMFSDTVTRAVGKAEDTLTEQFKDFKRHASRAASAVKPCVDSALRAAAKHPVRLAEESATAGVAASRQAAGALFSAMSRLMQDAAAIITGEATVQQPENEASPDIAAEQKEYPEQDG